jgi:hypothetical protein
MAARPGKEVHEILANDGEVSLLAVLKIRSVCVPPCLQICLPKILNVWDAIF